MPDILLDPGITIIEIRQVGPLIRNVYSSNGQASLVHVFISDEDAAYLQLKYPHAVSNIFTKVDK